MCNLEKYFPVVKSEVIFTSDGLVETPKTNLPCALAIDQSVSWISRQFHSASHASVTHSPEISARMDITQFAMLYNKSLIRCFVVYYR